MGRSNTVVLLLQFTAVAGLALQALPTLGATLTERIATGFSRPVFVTAPPQDTQRLFVVEQQSGSTGRIQVLDLNTNSVLGTFLEIPNLKTGNEQGLLGLAFDPNYASNGFFYVNITTQEGNGDTVIRRYQVAGDPATSHIANANSRFDVLRFDQPASNHNGGWIGFSPRDGYLYIASGDGGNANDCCAPGHTSGIGNAQDITKNLLGKILRIDPSRAQAPSVPYTIPESNPFVATTGDDEIWSYGLRNPYRASFDRTTGDLWIGDVGQNRREEVDFQPADSRGGENYGWRLREGTIATPTGGVGGNQPSGNVEPAYDYDHAAADPDFRGNVIIGGNVYRGPVASFVGHYFFADAGSNNIWKLDPDAVDIPASVTRMNDFLIPDFGSIGGIGSFGEDELGNLYIMEVFGGELFRIASSSEKVIWNGNDLSVGIPGNGNLWSSVLNWTRADTPDSGFVAGDNVVFATGSSQPIIDLQANRTVTAVRFEDSYVLQNNELRVLSGNVFVEPGVVATVESDLVAESVHQSIRKLGDGTLLVHGQVGQTAVKQGTLGGLGTVAHLTVQKGAHVAPGPSTGVLKVADSLTVTPGGTLQFEIGGTDNSDPQNPEFDALDVGGGVFIRGALRVTLVDLGDGLLAPEFGMEFPLITSPLSGALDIVFESIDLPQLAPGLQWHIGPSPANQALLLQVEIGLQGDYNLNGVVDSADYTVWRDRFGETVLRGSFADGNHDGVINQPDYDIWKAHFGNMAQVGFVQQVPEPTLAGLLLCGLTLVNFFRWPVIRSTIS